MKTTSSLFCFVLVVLSTKVYAALAKPLASANAKTNPQTSTERSKVSNYYLHQPYGPNTYAFGYELDDPVTGNVQFRDERRYLNGSIEGSFGYVRPDGLIEVTHFRADHAGGYLSQTQSYAPGDERAEAIWPTQRPELFVSSGTTALANVTWDAQKNLNVSVQTVAEDVTQQLKQQHGLDLNHIDVAKDLLQPGILDVVNGKAPLKEQPNGSLAFETVHNFIPKEFPIVPFQLPKTQEQQLLKAQTTTEPVELATGLVYEKAKSNNDEKALPMDRAAEAAAEEAAAAAAATEATSSAENKLPTPKPLAADQVEPNWYEQVIQANRREFLEQLPNLSH